MAGVCSTRNSIAEHPAFYLSSVDENIGSVEGPQAYCPDYLRPGCKCFACKVHDARVLRDRKRRGTCEIHVIDVFICEREFGIHVLVERSIMLRLSSGLVAHDA